MRARAWAAALALVLAGAPLSADTKSACASVFERAQTLRLEGKPRDALEAARQCALPTCPAVVRPLCAKWVTELEAELASVTISVHDAHGRELGGATASLDGAPTPTGTPVWVEKGAHRVTVEHEGRTATRSFDATAGERGRAVVLVLAAPTPAPSASQAPASDSVEPARDRPAPRAGAFVAAGVAVVGLGAFAYFGSQGTSRRDELERTCAPRCADSDVDAVRKKLLLADAGLAVALVAGGAATYLFLRPSPRAAVGVGPAGAVARWSF